MAEINSDDIQSMTFLTAKDATDKYGEKGKNGILEVTMKKKDNWFIYNLNLILAGWSWNEKSAKK